MTHPEHWRPAKEDPPTQVAPAASWRTTTLLALAILVLLLVAAIWLFTAAGLFHQGGSPPVPTGQGAARLTLCF